MSELLWTLRSQVRGVFWCESSRGDNPSHGLGMILSAFENDLGQRLTFRMRDAERHALHTDLLRDFCRLTRNCQCRRSEEHTSELQSLTNLVCRLLLEKK